MPESASHITDMEATNPPDGDGDGDPYDDRHAVLLVDAFGAEQIRRGPEWRIDRADTRNAVAATAAYTGEAHPQPVTKNGRERKIEPPLLRVSLIHAAGLPVRFELGRGVPSYYGPSPSLAARLYSALGRR
jgi:hypothetical protein